VLADEINRATPRTQSALLEAMSEKQVTVDGLSHPLGPPFLVLATQNPFEFEGTYPLPESQLDRFLVRLRIGYPARQAEKEILSQHRQGEPVDQLQAVLTPADVLALQRRVRDVRFDDRLQDYLLTIVEATRSAPQVDLGASTRAGLGLYRAAQALALLHDRDYVVPDDIKYLAIPVLGHRLLMKTLQRAGARDAAEAFLTEELQRIPVPA
jgi:MoxR-like ATPase